MPLGRNNVSEGLVDLRPTLQRIENGTRLAHRNDGTIFKNREALLPLRGDGYYREYVHPTPSIIGPGPQRIVSGGEGELFYTPDHYQTFTQIR